MSLNDGTISAVAVATGTSGMFEVQPFYVGQNLAGFGYPSIPQPAQEVRRTKELRIVASLKGFDVSYTDSHGSVKSSEYSSDELTKALPDLLARLTKEPKEE